MRKYRSGIGQNAEVSPLGQRVEPWNSHVIRAVLFIISRYVAIPAFAQALLRPLPQAACLLPQVGQISLPQTP
jgi:hypothetical protein